MCDHACIRTSLSLYTDEAHVVRIIPCMTEVRSKKKKEKEKDKEVGVLNSN